MQDYSNGAGNYRYVKTVRTIREASQFCENHPGHVANESRKGWAIYRFTAKRPEPAFDHVVR